MIPKEYVIEYVTGEHYAEYKYALKVQILTILRKYEN